MRPAHALVASVLMAAPLPAQAQAPEPTTVDPLSVPRPSIRAARVDGDVVIDGLLDEAAWQQAVPTSETWIQITPEPGRPATERTEVRVIYDADNLYIGAVLYDSHPDRLVVPGLEQDFDTPNSDMFGLALDTYHDRQNSFLFGTNPAGAIFDAQTFDDQRALITAWEGISEVRTTVNDSSWIVEMAIPFSTLRFDPSLDEQTWGFNMSRRVRRRNEDSMWAPVPLQYRVYKMSMAGTLEGLRDLPRSHHLWVKPYVLGDRLSGANVTDSDPRGEVGLDVKWGLTPRMTLDLTANTDFSQVEVDAEQVNLTRFSLFFPEKRDFFLENEGTFAFQDISIRNFRTGSSGRNFRLFHSRRIGLSDTREVLPIGGGARLTGRLGQRVEIGLLNMQTRSTDDLPSGAPYDAENFAVARLKTNLGSGSSVGAIFVNRQQTGGAGDEYNRALGVDANFDLFRNFVVSGYFARTEERDPVGEDPNIAMGQIAWRSAVWDASVLFKHVGDGFNPGLGFIDRTAVRRYFGTLGVHPKVRRAGVLELNPYVDVDVFTNLGGSLETRTIQPGLDVLLMSGGSLRLSYADRHERLFDPTVIAGATVVPGTYEWKEPEVRLVTPGNKALSGSVSVTWGDFYDGSRTSLSASARLRPNEHFSFEAGAQRNDLELGGTTFTANLFSGRLRLARDTRTFFMAFVQYNEATDELISNVRFNLIHAPLSDVFLVFTERRLLADGITDPVRERGVTLKVTKLLAF